MNCMGCEHLQRMDEDCYGGHKPYYCGKFVRLLKHRYTDEEFPEVEPCEECKHEMQ
jgi:hypothetical protein